MTLWKLPDRTSKSALSDEGMPNVLSTTTTEVGTENQAGGVPRLGDEGDKQRGGGYYPRRYGRGL